MGVILDRTYRVPKNRGRVGGLGAGDGAEQGLEEELEGGVRAQPRARVGLRLRSPYSVLPVPQVRNGRWTLDAQPAGQAPADENRTADRP